MNEQPSTATYAASAIDPRFIASRQRAINVCILAYFLCLIAAHGAPKEIRPLVTLAGLGIGVIGVVCTFSLAARLYNSAMGVVMGLLAFVPLINLVVLLKVTNKANALFRARGVEVGLFGPKRIPS